MNGRVVNVLCASSNRGHLAILVVLKMNFVVSKLRSALILVLGLLG